MADLTRIVEEIYGNFGRGNVAAIADSFAEDIRFVHAGGSVIPYAMDRHGKSAAMAFFADLAESVDISQFEVREYVEQGNSVVALGLWAGRARSTGKSFATDWAMLWAFDGTKVKFYQGFEDTLAVGQAFSA